MAWNYIIEVAAGDDVKAAVVAKHQAHIAKYPGVSQEHAIAATPSVEAAADKAVAAVAKLKAKGPVRIRVSGPDAYDEGGEVEATAEAIEA